MTYLEHSAGAATRRARPESDQETNPITDRHVRLPVRSGRACRPARQAGPPNLRTPSELLGSCSLIVRRPNESAVDRASAHLKASRYTEPENAVGVRSRPATAYVAQVFGPACRTWQD